MLYTMQIIFRQVFWVSYGCAKARNTVSKKFLVELNTSGGEVLQMETFQAFQKMKEMPTAFLPIMIFWQFMQCNHCKDLDTEYLKIYPLLDLIIWHYQKYWSRH